MKKIFLISLGCPKNRVDSESFLGLAGERGYAVTAFPEEADILVLNTCGFLRTAVEEGRAHLRDLLRVKKKTGAAVILWGCLVQRYPARCAALPVDGVVGTGDPAAALSAADAAMAGRRVVKIPVPACSRFAVHPRLLTTAPYAYLKIAEGCDNRCAYCLIPSLRGPLHSRPVASLVREARGLKHIGVKELILVAQDTTAYGRDRKDGVDIVSLLRGLVPLGFPWIRLLYAHPAHVTDRFLGLMAKEKSICSYLDIPLQHVHPAIVRRMGRPVMDYRALIERIRNAVPNVRLRTTVIAGFPGETEEMFEYLCCFVQDLALDRLGIFAYSREQGTRAYRFSGQVSEREKTRRVEILADIQRGISRKNLRTLAGRTIRVLIDGVERNGYVGRTEYEAPEIDGVVHVTGTGRKPGDFVTVKILRSDDHDLFGETVDGRR